CFRDVSNSIRGENDSGVSTYADKCRVSETCKPAIAKDEIEAQDYDHKNHHSCQQSEQIAVAWEKFGHRRSCQHKKQRECQSECKSAKPALERRHLAPPGRKQPARPKGDDNCHDQIDQGNAERWTDQQRRAAQMEFGGYGPAENVEDADGERNQE